MHCAGGNISQQCHLVLKEYIAGYLRKKLKEGLVHTASYFYGHCTAAHSLYNGGTAIEGAEIAVAT